MENGHPATRPYTTYNLEDEMETYEIQTDIALALNTIRTKVGELLAQIDTLELRNSELEAERVALHIKA